GRTWPTSSGSPRVRRSRAPRRRRRRRRRSGSTPGLLLLLGLALLLDRLALLLLLTLLGLASAFHRASRDSKDRSACSNLADRGAGRNPLSDPSLTYEVRHAGA